MHYEGCESSLVVLLWTTLIAPALLVILQWWLSKR